MHTVRVKRTRPWLLPLLAVVALAVGGSAGCGRRGPPLGTVNGTVTFHGEPVGAGFVIFENLDQGWTRSDALRAEGSYQLVEVPVAEYVVRVVPPEPALRDERTGFRGGDLPPMPDPKNIPKRYREANETPLRAKVLKGKNRCDFDLAR